MEKRIKAIGRNDLNVTYLKDGFDEKGHYAYEVCDRETGDCLLEIRYQRGPRNKEYSENGVLDLDLLFTIRDRIQTFQKGEYSCHENEMVLQKIEEAIFWSQKRVEDRREREVLGTYNK